MEFGGSSLYGLKPLLGSFQLGFGISQPSVAQPHRQKLLQRLTDKAGRQQGDCRVDGLFGHDLLQLDAHSLYFSLGVDDFGLANVALLRHLLLKGSLLALVDFKVLFGLLELASPVGIVKRDQRLPLFYLLPLSDMHLLDNPRNLGLDPMPMARLNDARALYGHVHAEIPTQDASECQ